MGLGDLHRQSLADAHFNPLPLRHNLLGTNLSFGIVSAFLGQTHQSAWSKRVGQVVTARAIDPGR